MNSCCSPTCSGLQSIFFFLVPWESYFLDQGLKLYPLHWECGVLTTGPLGKFQLFFFFKQKFEHIEK